MRFYIQISQYEQFEVAPIWKIEKNEAHRVDVVSSLSAHAADAGEEALVTLQKRFSGSTFHELSLRPGQYYPRMARPYSTRENESPGENPEKSTAILHARAVSTGQLHALIGQLEQICRVVHPTPENFSTFGHEIRNVLILACTESEAHWKNILKANREDGRNTRDHVKLSLAMKLGEYEVQLPYYPWIDPVLPFENWVPSDSPSKGLGWYAAYNNVKHDRESHFSDATLVHAIRAVTACFVMLCAQYGWDFALRGDAALRSFFRLTKAPRWEPADVYVPPYGGELEQVPYPFPK